MSDTNTMIPAGTFVSWEPRPEWGEPTADHGKVVLGIRGADGVTYRVRVAASTHIHVHESRLVNFR